MTKYYIQLSDDNNEYDRIDLSEAQLDNNSYNVYAIALCENGEVLREMYFAEKSIRDDYAKENGIDIVNDDWIYDAGTFSITCDHDTWFEYIPCKVDILMGYTEVSEDM